MPFAQDTNAGLLPPPGSDPGATRYTEASVPEPEWVDDPGDGLLDGSADADGPAPAAEPVGFDAPLPAMAPPITDLPRRRRVEGEGRGGEGRGGEGRQGEMIRDHATGLVPRATFGGRLQDLLDLGLPVGVIAVGLDWPDGPGAQSMADATLVTAVAKRVTTGLRGSDLVASFGSDGFVVLLPDVPAPEVLHAIARRLVTAASGPVSLHGQQIEGRGSAAWSMPAGADLRGEQVVAMAIRARRRARALGGERVLGFDPRSTDEAVPAVVWPAEELERALQAGEFEAWFQPVVDVATADLAGFEALMRWVHPDLGVLTPPQFLDAAEEAGLLGRLSTEIMRQALRHLSRWDDRVPDRLLTMAVNLSARHLAVLDLTDTIGDLVAAGGLPAERLRIDVSERTLTAEPDTVAAQITALRRAGVRVCLDDFGAGSASMALLQRIPFDVLKLDRSLLDTIDTDPGRTVLEALVRFGHSVGAVLVAEHVETSRELSVLRGAGCDQAQGRLFSGPRTAGEIDTMLDRWLGQPKVSAAS